MIHLDRLAVFIGTEKADVEAMPRVFEVVGVTTEEGDVPFGGKDEPNVGVAAKAIEVEPAASEQGDNVAPQPSGFKRLLFNAGQHLPAGVGRGNRIGLVGNGSLHLSGDVLD